MSQKVSSLKKIVKEFERVMNALNYEKSRSVFNLQGLSLPTQDRAYRIIRGEIEENETNFSPDDTICSEKKRALIIYVAFKTKNNEDHAYNYSIIEAEEKIEESILQDQVIKDKGWLDKMLGGTVEEANFRDWFVLALAFPIQYGRSF